MYVVWLPTTTTPPFKVSRAGKHLRVTETQGDGNNFKPVY